MITFTYKGYRTPVAGKLQLIVKALPVVHPAGTQLCVNFVGFRPEGFAVRVTNTNGTQLKIEELQQAELIVEVSEYVVAG